MSFFSKKQSTIKEIWLKSFQLYRKVFSQVWYFGIIIGAILTLMLLINVISRIDGFVYKIGGGVAFLAIILAIVYITSLVLYRINNMGNEQNPSLRNEMALTNKKYIKVAFSMLIVLLLYMLGMVLFILPGIFVLVLFGMAQPLILFDDQGVLGSLKGSCKLVWGNWWYNFAILFPLILLTYWITFATNYALLRHQWYLIGINILLAMIFHPLAYTCVLVLFNDLKLRSKK